jgi:hypothetical protein
VSSSRKNRIGSKSCNDSVDSSNIGAKSVQIIPSSCTHAFASEEHRLAHDVEKSGWDQNKGAKVGVQGIAHSEEMRVRATTIA